MPTIRCNLPITTHSEKMQKKIDYGYQSSQIRYSCSILIVTSLCSVTNTGCKPSIISHS